VKTRFSKNYLQARARFIAASHAARAQLCRHYLPDVTGPEGENLTLDVATLPGRGAGALVIVSGTHGVEGYAGSAVQLDFLTSQTFHRASEMGLTLVLVHAHNPYGFAWDGRFNENNIDLNRNYLDWGRQPLPEAPDYDRLASAIMPSKRTPKALENADGKLIAFGREAGMGRLQAAITGGQYAHPLGLYYGGTGPSWSNLAMHRVLATLGKEPRICMLDIHTGLGPFGHGELIVDAAPGTPRHRLAQTIWGNAAVKSTQDGGSVSAILTGTLEDGAARAFPNAAFAYAALEFGTVDPMQVFRATQAWTWHVSRQHLEGRAAETAKADMRAAFDPDSDAWRQAVLDRSSWAVARAIDWLARGE
jgi:hypothetical protein